MNLKHFNHWENEFFAEKRLVFKEGGEKNPVRSTEKEVKRETSEEFRARMIKELNALKKKVDKNRNKAMERHDSQTANIDNDNKPNTINKMPERESNPEINEVIERNLKLQGLMSMPEIQNMELAHLAISNHYMNPAFMLRIKELNESGQQQVYGAFDAILKAPYKYEYSHNSQDHTITITPRNDVQDAQNISVTIKTDEDPSKYIVTKVNDVELADPKGAIPWEGVDYLSHMNEKQNQFWEHFMDQTFSLLEYPETPFEELFSVETIQRIRAKVIEETKKKTTLPGMQETFSQMPDKLKEMLAHDTITVPLNLIQLVEARGYDFELNDENYKALKAQKGYLEGMKDKGWREQYAELTKNYDNNPILVAPLPDVDAYTITVGKGADKRTLVVHKSGLLMHQNAETGIWEIHPDYNHKLRDDYFDEHKDRNARELIEGKKTTESGGASTIMEKVAELRANDEIMRPILLRLKDASWDEYTIILLEGFTAPEQYETNKSFFEFSKTYFAKLPEDERMLKDELYRQISAIMRRNSEKMKIVARILKVPLPEKNAEK